MTMPRDPLAAVDREIAITRGRLARDTEALVDPLRQRVRRQPMGMLLGGFAAAYAGGFLLGRLDAEQMRRAARGVSRVSTLGRGLAGLL